MDKKRENRLKEWIKTHKKIFMLILIILIFIIVFLITFIISNITGRKNNIQIQEAIADNSQEEQSQNVTVANEVQNTDIINNATTNESTNETTNTSQEENNTSNTGSTSSNTGSSSSSSGSGSSSTSTSSGSTTSGSTSSGTTTTTTPEPTPEPEPEPSTGDTGSGSTSTGNLPFSVAYTTERTDIENEIISVINNELTQILQEDVADLGDVVYTWGICSVTKGTKSEAYSYSPATYHNENHFVNVYKYGKTYYVYAEDVYYWNSDGTYATLGDTNYYIWSK